MKCVECDDKIDLEMCHWNESPNGMCDLCHNDWLDEFGVELGIIDEVEE